MVTQLSPLSIKGIIPKTEKRRKSDEIKKRKKKAGIDIDTDEECDWTYEGSPSIELPDISDLEL